MQQEPDLSLGKFGDVRLDKRGRRFPGYALHTQRLFAADGAGRQGCERDNYGGL